MIRRRSHKLGLTLIELIMGLAVFMVLVNGAAKLYTGAFRLSQVGKIALDSMDDLDVARDELQKFTRAAADMPQNAGAYEQSDSLLLLQLQNDRVAVLGQPTPDSPPVSMIIERTGEHWETVYLKTLPNRLKALRFEREPRCVTMTVTVDNLGMENTVPAENAFIAALRARPTDAEITVMDEAL